MPRKFKDPYGDFTQKKLPPGYTHYHLYKKEDFVYFCLIVKIGSNADPKGKEGLAHLIEHLLFRNGNFKTGIEFRQFCSLMGGEFLEAKTSGDHTWYAVKIPAKDSCIKQMLTSLFSMFHGVGALKGFNKELRIIKSERNDIVPFEKYVEKITLARRHLFFDTSMAQDGAGIGTIQTLEGITRKDAYHFWNDFYMPDNVSIVTSGGISEKKMREYILAAHDKFSKGRPKKYAHSTTNYSIYTHHTGRGRVFEFDIEEVYGKENKNGKESYFGFTHFPFETNIYAMRVLAAMIASEVFLEIREKKASTYAIDANVVEAKNFKAISIVSKSLNRSETETIVENVFAIIKRVKNNKKLFNIVKLSTIRQFQYNGESLATITQTAKDNIVNHGRIVSLKEDIAAYKKITMQDINALLTHMTLENMVHAIFK